MPNQELPIVLSQKIIGWPELDQVLPNEIVSYHIFVHLLQVYGDLRWDLGWSYVVFSWLQAIFLAQNPDFQVSFQGASLVRSNIVTNMGGSDRFWYLTMYFGTRYPMEPSLVGAEGSDR